MVKTHRTVVKKENGYKMGSVCHFIDKARLHDAKVTDFEDDACWMITQ